RSAYRGTGLDSGREPVATGGRCLRHASRLLCREHRSRRSVTRRSEPAMKTLVRTSTLAFLALTAAVVATAAEAPLRLIDAVKSGNREVVRTLLKQPAELKVTERDGTTALHYAVRSDDLEMVRMLLRAGADATAATREGITPLQLAAVNGSTAATEALLEAGANPNAVLPEGETVLMTAARTGNAGVLEILIEHGADLKAREKWYGETALMWAAAENHVDAIKLL